jgi:hypothetical protein
MTFKWIIRLTQGVLGPLLTLLTPQIRSLMEDWLQKIWAKAAATDNGFDDMVVGFLFDILDIERPDEP